MPRWSALVCALACVGGLLTGCANNSAPAPGEQRAPPAGPAPAPGGIALPAPSRLDLSRSASLVETQVERAGQLFELALPLNKVAVSGDDAMFSPTWEAAPQMLSDLAYCTYVFDVPGYDRNAAVGLTWMAPLPAGTFFVGLANWERDAWDWYPGSTDKYVNLPGTMDRYIDANDLVAVVVAVLGNQTRTLDRIRLGNVPPLAALASNVTQGAIPFDFELDAGASTDPEFGAALSFEFDADGDGTYDSGAPSATSTFDAQLPVNGTYDAQVRVTNQLGLSSTATVTVHAVGEWIHTWGTGQGDQFWDADAGADGMIYAVGTLTDDTFESHLVLTKWTPAGRLEWARLWEENGQSLGRAVRVDSAGDIIVAGSTELAGNSPFLLQKWSPDGDLLWCKRLGTGQCNNARLILDTGAIYLAGDTTGIGSNSPNLFLARFTGNGDEVWQRYSDSGGADRLGSVAPVVDLLGFKGVCLGSSSVFNTQNGVWKVEFNTSGTATSEQAMVHSTDQMFTNIRVLRTFSLLTGDVSYFTTALLGDSVGNLFMARTDEAGAETWAYLYNGCFGNVYSFGFALNGNPLVLGNTDPGARLWEVEIDRASGFATTENTYVGNSNGRFRTQTLTSYGLLLGGSLPDTDYTFDQDNFVPNAIDMSYTNWAGTDGDPGFILVTVFADTVTDVTSAGMLDSGGGNDDTMLWLRPDL